ncbi:MAG: von Willebrand factor, type, partial [Conexibacter sp.]|nr:von Willebrand factor, type [Conexibacter sp.]
ATGALPAGGRAIVLSDGLATSGDAAGAADAARRAGVTVDGVALPRASTPVDAAVTRFVAPSPLHSGDPLTLQATVASTVAHGATLELTRDGAPIGRQLVTLRRGENPLLLSYRAPSAGWHAYRLRIVLDGDAVVANDTLDATTRVAAPPRALIVEGAAGRAGGLPALLRRDGIDASTTTPAALPKAAAGLAGEDVVVLADVPAPALASAQVRALRSAVRAGSGLLVLGGEHSLSLGRYAATPLDAMLPVQSIAPGGVRRRQLALQLVLDRSSSMNDLAGGGLDPKIAMARAAARSALAFTARDDDELGLVAFDAVPHVVVPLQRVTGGNAGPVGQQLDSLDANGGTNVLRGLESGLAQVQQSSAAVKHLVLLSDGVSEPADYAPVLARVRGAHVTLSTIALGRDADAALLRRLAQQGNGRFYDVPDARSLPRVFAQEARRSAPSVAVRGTLPVTAAAASPLLASLSDRALPPLGGTVVTRLRDGAIAPLTTAVNGSSTPVLAQWQYGLGRVVVWTPGAGAWAGGWLDRQPGVFGDAARWSERGVATPALEPALDPTDASRLLVDPLATAGRTLELANVEATLRTPAGATRVLDVAQVAPSRYAAALAGAAAGVYGVGVAAHGGDGDALPSAQALVAVPYAAEYALRPADTSVLGSLASATGGRLRDVAAPAAALTPDGGTALWRIPAGATILLLLAAVAAGARPRAPSRLDD